MNGWWCSGGGVCRQSRRYMLYKLASTFPIMIKSATRGTLHKHEDYTRCSKVRDVT